MDQLQHGLLTLPSRWGSSFPRRWGDFLAGTNQQRRRAQKVLPVLTADSNHALSLGARIHSSLEGRIHGFQHMETVPSPPDPPGSPAACQGPFPGSQMSGEQGNDPIHPLSMAFVHGSPVSCCEKRENWMNLFNWNAGSPLLSSCKLFLDSCYLDFQVKTFLRCNFSIGKKKKPNHQTPEHIITFPCSPFEVKWTSKDFSFFTVVMPLCEWVPSQKPVVREHCCISSV